MGAWIETLVLSVSRLLTVSLPVWERGLKLMLLLFYVKKLMSLPVWERGLKP